MCDKQSMRLAPKTMSRKERRKQEKKQSKGGSPIPSFPTRGYYSGDPVPLILKTVEKCGKEGKLENILRSKNVSGY